MRVGLRTQILAALLLVTLGGIVSVGLISVWSTRRVLAAEHLERVAEQAALGGRLVGQLLESEADAEARRARLSAEWGSISLALGGGELAYFDVAGAAVFPVAPPAMATDATGRGGAIAGVPPHVTQVEGGRVAAYGRVQVGGRTVGALRLVVRLDAAVDATLERAQWRVVLLGALNGLVLLAAAAWILRTSVLRPVMDLERVARRVAAGDLEARTVERGPGELGRLAEAFDGMTRSLKENRESLVRSEKLAGVGRLAAGVAHEVGNPLAAILGYVETLLTDTPERPIEPALRHDILTRVRGETERIHRIIQELADSSRPPRDEIEAVPVRATVEAAVSLCKAQARARDVEVRVAVADDVPAVQAATGRLTQVLVNLLLNAADAMDGRGQVVVDARADGAQVIVGVEDRGPGVPAEARGRVFDPFYTTKDPGKGTGLGLSVSLAIVEGMGGTLRLCPAPAAGGARFEISLQCAR